MLGMSDGDAADLVIDYGALADNLEVERKHLFASFNVSGSLVDQIGYETTEAFLLLHEAGHCRRGSSGRSYALAACRAYPDAGNVAESQAQYIARLWMSPA